MPFRNTPTRRREQAALSRKGAASRKSKATLFTGKNSVG
jgi:hypothetical protein